MGNDNTETDHMNETDETDETDDAEVKSPSNSSWWRWPCGWTGVDRIAGMNEMVGVGGDVVRSKQAIHNRLVLVY